MSNRPARVVTVTKVEHVEKPIPIGAKRSTRTRLTTGSQDPLVSLPAKSPVPAEPLKRPKALPWTSEDQALATAEGAGKAQRHYREGAEGRLSTESHLPYVTVLSQKTHPVHVYSDEC